MFILLREEDDFIDFVRSSVVIFISLVLGVRDVRWYLVKSEKLIKYILIKENNLFNDFFIFN